MLAVWSPLIASMYLIPHRHELLHQDLRLWNRLMNEPFTFHQALHQHHVRSSAFEELDASYQLTFGVPGLRASDMTATLHLDGDQAVVILNGETKTKGHETKIRRRLLLPADADAETVSVACADGLLTVSVFKETRSEPRVLPVSNDVALIDNGDESNDAFRQALLVPGLRAEEMKVTLEDKGILVVEGESKRRRPLRVLRRLKLPRTADIDGISCSLSDGVLTLIAPKRQAVEVEPRDLPVQACLPGECA